MASPESKAIFVPSGDQERSATCGPAVAIRLAPAPFGFSTYRFGPSPNASLVPPGDQAGPVLSCRKPAAPALSAIARDLPVPSITMSAPDPEVKATRRLSGDHAGISRRSQSPHNASSWAPQRWVL